MKSYRQQLVSELVEQEPITSQEQLRERLRGKGIEVTQATLSRDIRDLGLVKRAGDGAYRRPGAEAAPRGGAEPQAALRRAVAEFLRRVEAVHQLVVLKTDPGQAQTLAIALDRARHARRRWHDRRRRHDPRDLSRRSRRAGIYRAAEDWVRG